MDEITPDSVESVWQYPRPPRVEPCELAIRVVFGGQTIAETKTAKRVLETSHPPVYYIPAEAIRTGVLLPAERKTFCEWKGIARYFHIMVDDFVAEHAAWEYNRPTSAFDVLREHVAFYAHLMDACYVGGERVQAQLGGFYGGWITKSITGPFKGAAGTQGW